MVKPIQHLFVRERRGSSLLLYVPLQQGLQLWWFLFWLGELNHPLRAFREPGPWTGVVGQGQDSIGRVQDLLF